MTNIFSNCDSTIMGNSSNKEKDKEINGINIPKVSTFPTDNWSAVPLFWKCDNQVFLTDDVKLNLLFIFKKITLWNFAFLQIFLGFGKMTCSA